MTINVAEPLYSVLLDLVLVPFFSAIKKCSDKSQFGYVQAYGCKSLRICFLHEIIRENTTIRKLHSTYFQA